MLQNWTTTESLLMAALLVGGQRASETWAQVVGHPWNLTPQWPLKSPVRQSYSWWGLCTASDVSPSICFWYICISHLWLRWSVSAALRA